MLYKEAKGKPTTSYSPFLNHFNAVIKKKPIDVVPSVTSIPPLCDAAAKRRSVYVKTLNPEP